jgi:hypothetical protein
MDKLGEGGGQREEYGGIGTLFMLIQAVQMLRIL